MMTQTHNLQILGVIPFVELHILGVMPFENLQIARCLGLQPMSFALLCTFKDTNPQLGWQGV